MLLMSRLNSLPPRMVKFPRVLVKILYVKLVVKSVTISLYLLLSKRTAKSLFSFWILRTSSGLPKERMKREARDMRRSWKRIVVANGVENKDYGERRMMMSNRFDLNEG